MTDHYCVLPKHNIKAECIVSTVKIFELINTQTFVHLCLLVTR